MNRKMNSKSFTALMPWVKVLLALSIVPLFQSDGQFISHINSKGLRGNLTFDVKEETGATLLVIESIIESDNRKDEELPISFDWSLHTNILQPHMLHTCTSDDLGQEVSSTLQKSLTENRAIILNKKLNRWILPLKDFLQENRAKTLSSLIWHRSVRLRLSSSYAEKVQLSQPTPPASVSSAGRAAQAPKAPAAETQRFVRPSLAPVAAAPSAAPSKPTFAPRPRPSISGRLKPTTSRAPSLPKALALVMEQEAPKSDTSTTAKPLAVTSSSTTSTTTTPKPAPDPKEIALIEANKRILRRFGKVQVCGNIIDTRNVKTVVANFESQIAGQVTMRGNEDDTTLISLNLYHLKSKVSTRHEWKILAADILDERKHEEQCKYLQFVFDPNNIDDTDCKKDDQLKCKMGNLGAKHGQIQVAGQGKSTRSALIDLNLPLWSLEGSRSLFLVIYEAGGLTKANSTPQKPNILSCAEIVSVNQRKLEANFNMDGVRGSIRLSQRHSTEPTTITYDLFGLEGNVKHLTIRELPLAARVSSDNGKLCNSLGGVFNPLKVASVIDGNDRLTIDAIAVGNLSAKHGHLSVIDSDYEDHYMGELMDLSVQLYGPHLVAGRSLVVHKNNGDPWVCATLDYAADEPVELAVATFHYPVVGRVVFQQLANDARAETGVLVEVYNPNSERDSDGHQWMVHLRPAMADFYNWSQRCESAGEVYDPLNLVTANGSSSNELYARQCLSSLNNEPLRCRSGDTSLKSGLRLSLPISHLNRSRLYYTDPHLPLSRANSIIGRSVVIYDERAPTQRGNRLACSTIKSVHPIRAAVKNWSSGPSIPSAVSGSMLFEQDSVWRPTRIRMDLSGVNGNVENYAIHYVWMMDDREFPCSNDSLYDIYDPYDTENSLSLPPSAHYGSLATVDRVKVGDMSRKHGTFEGQQSVRRSVVDSNVALFATKSIVGRSLVLRAAVNDFRWVCGNIELDYDRQETREIVAMASFDEPRSKIAGYVRLVQLEHKDGSLSDTFVQVDLRMQADGVHELETSHGHNWVVFVNQVGEDAFIAADEVRCIAAGFKWNPYLAQDTLETYPNSCNPSEQLACAMGDLGMRHGSLTLGPNNRRAISDINLPLVGNYSVTGRSLVIFDNKRPTLKLACANIFPDIHLKSDVVIKRMPSFTVAGFMEQMRTLLGAAEWLMVPDLKATKSVANGECVQLTIHFYGRKAHQMQSELNNLITMGSVLRSTRFGNGEKISTHYKLC